MQQNAEFVDALDELLSTHFRSKVPLLEKLTVVVGSYKVHFGFKAGKIISVEQEIQNGERELPFKAIWYLFHKILDPLELKLARGLEGGNEYVMDDFQKNGHLNYMLTQGVFI